MKLTGLLLLVLAGGAPPCHAMADVDALLATLDAIREQSGVPAYGIALVEGERTVFAGARGVADLATGRAAGPQTVFRVGSITKTFTALAVMKAVEAGAVDLEATVAEVLGQGLLTNPWADTRPVRLVHLLEHTAGLAELSGEEMYHSDPAPLALGAALRLRPANRQVLWPPGTHYSYTNAGAGLASYVLEQRTGTTFEAYLASEILVPLGIGDASLLFDARADAHLATGYDSDRRTPIPYWHMLFRAFGALNARPAEMAELVKLLLARGTHAGRRLLRAESVARMEQPRTTLAARSGLTFGYGLGVYAWHHRGIVFHGHGGDGDGYLAHFGYAPRSGRGYFIVINAFTHGPLARMRRAIESWVANDTTPATPPDIVEPPAGVTGRYERATTRFPPPPGDVPDALVVTRSAGRLTTRLNDGRPRALLAVNGRHFRRPGESGATIAIVPGPDGRFVFQGERQTFVRTGPVPGIDRP